LREEVFGPVTLLVGCRDIADMVATVSTLEGQLTATVHEHGDDLAAADALLWALEQRAGRLVFNGYPTGVEVCPSMVHGGPWPATTDSRFTSVGTAAILRFVRPVCYQNAPDVCLPEELKDDNSRRIWRHVNGEQTRASLHVPQLEATTV
jgi:NADP-dependent aldehyde dehydrogenase